MQTLPGPMPTLVASAPQFSRSMTPSGVPTFPAMTKVCGSYCLMWAIIRCTASAWPWALSMVM